MSRHPACRGGIRWAASDTIPARHKRKASALRRCKAQAEPRRGSGVLGRAGGPRCSIYSYCTFATVTAAAHSSPVVTGDRNCFLTQGGSDAPPSTPVLLEERAGTWGLMGKCYKTRPKPARNSPQVYTESFNASAQILINPRTIKPCTRAR